MIDKLIPRVKFNNGRLATICTKCRIIINEGISDEVLCEKCKELLCHTDEKNNDLAQQ